MKLNERIYNLRKEKGLSQEALSDLLGVSRQSVSKWELAESNPDLNNIIMLSKIFGCTTDYLLTGLEKEDNIFKKDTKERSLLIFSIILLFVPFLVFIGVATNNSAVFTFFIILGFLAVFASLGLFIYQITNKTKSDLSFKNDFILYTLFFNILLFSLFLEMTLSIKINPIIGDGITVIFIVLNTLIIKIKKFNILDSKLYLFIAIVFLVIHVILMVLQITLLPILSLLSISYIIYNIGLLKLK